MYHLRFFSIFCISPVKCSCRCILLPQGGTSTSWSFQRENKLFRVYTLGKCWKWHTVSTMWYLDEFPSEIPASDKNKIPCILNCKENHLWYIYNIITIHTWGIEHTTEPIQAKLSIIFPLLSMSHNCNGFIIA